tara:strand:- start:23 stop:760 length:738 start_codon:yes stop_codon:yes gene_type:complete
VKIHLQVWRQKSAESSGFFETHTVDNITEDMSFFEMLDMLNNDLIKDKKSPIAFDHDCREGICGTCGLVINGRPHGPLKGVTSCQLHMRSFKDGDTLTLEPFRASSFPVVKDLAINRKSFDRILESGGYISVKTGGAPDGNATPIFKDNADEAFDSATCIGCGACVAACKNSSAMLFVGAKVNQYANLPQGLVEHKKRVNDLVTAMDNEGFGSCTNTGACEAECPKEISIENIIKLNSAYIKSAK